MAIIMRCQKRRLRKWLCRKLEKKTVLPIMMMMTWSACIAIIYILIPRKDGFSAPDAPDEHIAHAPELMIMTLRQFLHVNCALNKKILLRSALPSRWYHFTCSWGQNGPRTVIFLNCFFSYLLMFKFGQRRFYERNYVLLL